MADLTPKPITELPLGSALGEADLFALASGGVSKSLTGRIVRNASYAIGTQILGGEDLDDYTTPGIYAIASGAIADQVLNCPYNGANSRIVVSAAGTSQYDSYLIQILVSANTPKIYIRRKVAGTWGAWGWLNNADPNVFQPGDTESVAAYSIPLTGLVLADGKTVHFDYTASKSLAEVSSVSVTSLKAALYGVSGVVGASTTSTEWVGQSGVTVTAIKINNEHIRITIVSSAALSNVVGSTPISAFATFTLAFS